MLFFPFSLDEKKVTVNIFCFIFYGQPGNVNTAFLCSSHCFLFLPVFLFFPCSLDLYIMRIFFFFFFFIIRNLPKFSDDLKKEDGLVNRKLLKK